MTRPSDEALWASVAETLRTVVLPALDEGTHVHATAVQLVGLAAYASSRGADPSASRRAALDAALAGLGANPLVPAEGTTEERVAAALAAAAGRVDDDASAARDALRPLLLAHLDADLAATAGLGEAFRGRLPDA